MTAAQIAEEIDSHLKKCRPRNKRGGYGLTEEEDRADRALSHFLWQQAETIRDALRGKT